MFRQLLCIAVALAAVQATGDFIILHSPPSVTFKGHEKVSQSLLKEIFTAALGFTVKQRSTWDGMFINDIRHLPKAVVSVVIEGVSSIKYPEGQHFPLIDDELEESTWQALIGRVGERGDSNTLVRIYFADGLDALGHSALGELKFTQIDKSSLKSLNPEDEEVKELLVQVGLLNAISRKVSTAITPDNKPDVYWFVLSALSGVINSHGEDSAEAKEAVTLVNDALSNLSNAFTEAYDGEVLISVFTNDASHVRHTRAVNSEGAGRLDNITVTNNRVTVEPTTESKLNQNVIETSGKPQLHTSNHISVESTTEGKPNHGSTETNEKQSRIIKSEDINISKSYDETYPVMFNIFLWFGVVFVFSLIAICIAIGDMDPGRDSIIYRMTSNRMKKDN